MIKEKVNDLPKANPQPENGHLDIPNELVEIFSKINLSSYEWRVLWALWRKTYSWHKDRDRISITQFEKLTELDRRHVVRTVKKLIQKRIIAQTGNGRKLSYGFQNDYLRWILPEQAIKSIVASRGNTSLPKQATNTLPKQAPTKEIKKLIKESEPSLSLKEEIPPPSRIS